MSTATFEGKTLKMPYWDSPTIGGFPLYWMDEQTGTLARPVKAFYRTVCGETPILEGKQLELFLDYCRYVIQAPCWDQNPDLQEEGKEALAALRKEAAEFKTVAEVRAWISKCLEIGIDPL